MKIKLAHTWFSNVTSDHFAKIEVVRCLDKLKHLSSYPIIIHNTTVKIDTKVSSDAFGSVYFVVNLDNQIKLKSVPFSELDSAKSFTWRELLPCITSNRMNQFVQDLRGLLLVITKTVCSKILSM